MTTTIPTEQAIRDMDGPALTRLAYMLGLAPEWVHWEDAWEGDVPGPCGIDRWGIISPYTMPWHPHDNLDQAAAVLRLLRWRGWQTVVYGGCESGLVEIHDETGQVWREHWGDDYAATPDALQTQECEAFLRCACLARAAHGCSPDLG